MTYAELGRLRGISAASAKRLALRHGWRKTAGNDGLARVSVPVTALAMTPETTPAMTPATKASVIGDILPTPPVLPQALSLLTDAWRQELEARKTAEAEARQQAEAAVRAEGELAGTREALRRADLAAEEAGQREALAVQALVLARAEMAATRQELREALEGAQRAEGEAQAMREALTRADAHAATLQADVARERATAQALLQAEAAERQAAEMARAELSAWTAGGPLTRALRGFFRRG
jgi:hypothetical protein